MMTEKLEHFGHPCKLPEPKTIAICSCGMAIYKGDLLGDCECGNVFFHPTCEVECDLCNKKMCPNCAETEIKKDWRATGWVVCGECRNSGMAALALLEESRDAEDLQFVCEIFAKIIHKLKIEEKESAYWKKLANKYSEKLIEIGVASAKALV